MRIAYLHDIRDCGAVEKGEIASSLRSSQRHKVRFQVIASDSKNRAAISRRHCGIFSTVPLSLVIWNIRGIF